MPDTTRELRSRGRPPEPTSLCIEPEPRHHKGPSPTHRAAPDLGRTQGRCCRDQGTPLIRISYSMPPHAARAPAASCHRRALSSCGAAARPRRRVDVVGGCVVKRDDELYGCFSPLAGDNLSSMCDAVSEGIAVVVIPVLQIVPKLQQLCATPASPQPMEHVEVVSRVTPREGRDPPRSCEQLEAFESIVSVISVTDCFCAMSWRIPLFGSSQQQQQQQPEPNFPNISTQSWYPPSVGGSSSLPSTPSSSGASPHQRASDHPQPSSRGQPSPAEAAGIIARLRDRSVDELQRLLKDKESYNAFFNSLDQVKTQNNLRDELRKETLQLARENLEKEQRILELRNQCTIIRTTELAAAEDRLTELERQKDEIMKSYSPAALLDKLQSTMAKLDEESEELHQKFLEKDVDLPTFVQKYKKLRAAHHKCALLHLSGKASLR
ncbi:hypothetical protein D1007_37613 [Hordeum vulgare]|nr:hypothetical protein D1007_37613 [Hordeum vulgare]